MHLNITVSDLIATARNIPPSGITFDHLTAKAQRAAALVDGCGGTITIGTYVIQARREAVQAAMNQDPSTPKSPAFDTSAPERFSVTRTVADLQPSLTHLTDTELLALSLALHDLRQSADKVQVTDADPLVRQSWRTVAYAAADLWRRVLVLQVQRTQAEASS